MMQLGPLLSPTTKKKSVPFPLHNGESMIFVSFFKVLIYSETCGRDGGGGGGGGCGGGQCYINSAQDCIEFFFPY